MDLIYRFEGLALQIILLQRSSALFVESGGQKKIQQADVSDDAP